MRQKAFILKRKNGKGWQFKEIRFLLIIVSFLCFTLVSCSNKPKGNAVFDLLVLRTEIESNGYNYSQSEWECAFDRYTEICQRLEEMDLTYEERLEIDKVKGEIAGTVASFTVQDISNEVEDIVDEFFSYAEGFVNSIQKQIMQE